MKKKKLEFLNLNSQFQEKSQSNSCQTNELLFHNELYEKGKK